MKASGVVAMVVFSICGTLWGAYVGSSLLVSSTDTLVHADDLRHINIFVFGAVGLFACLIVGFLIVKVAPKASLGAAISAAVLAFIPIGIFVSSNKVAAQKSSEVSVQDRTRDDKLKADSTAALDEIGKTLGLQTVVADDGLRLRSYAVNGTAQQMHDQLVALGAVQKMNSDPGFYSMELHRNSHLFDIYVSTDKDGKVVVNFTFLN